MKIYTKTGDSGKTSFYDGSCGEKYDPRFALIGLVDKLISELGVTDINSFEKTIMSDLMALNTVLATPKVDEPNAFDLSSKRNQKMNYTPNIEELETRIDLCMQQVGILKSFIYPENPIHIIRTTVRHVERKLCKLVHHHQITFRNHVIWKKYINRLSDFMFACAALCQKEEGHMTEWHHPLDLLN